MGLLRANFLLIFLQANVVSINDVKGSAKGLVLNLG